MTAIFPGRGKRWYSSAALSSCSSIASSLAVPLSDGVSLASGRRPARSGPEVLEPDVVGRRRGLEAGDVAAGFRAFLVGAQHNGWRVPADVRADEVLDGPVAGMPRLA